MEAAILAVGPWTPAQVTSSWRAQPWQPSSELDRRADAAIAALSARGSPAHDGLAARLAGWESSAQALTLELEPTRWALRLVEDGESRSLTAMCVVRSEDGRWLAGRRAGWLASWPGRWTLGAAGSVEVGENPALTLTRELEEEWQLVPSALSVSALVTLRSGVVALVGLATVPEDAEPLADAEHDEFAWWPADPGAWPDAADERLRRMAALLRSLEPRP
jgi:8-oxo-dGTP diphosphatase